VTRFWALVWLIVPTALAQELQTDTQSPFLSVAPPASDALRFGAQLPEFEAKDISGRTWRLEDLRGRFTLIYIWHTFAARVQGVPGLPEGRDLAELQRFHDQLSNAQKIQVLTFCKDYDYMHAHDYMKERGYTFPVIADWVLIDRLFPETGQGAKIVNPEGRLSYPFRSWTFGRLLFEVERAVARN
jgi:AhpC/TSA family